MSGVCTGTSAEAEKLRGLLFALVMIPAGQALVSLSP